MKPILKNKDIKKCKICGDTLTHLYPPVEDYIEHLFCIKIPFINWKFMLLRENIEYGCINCLIDEDKDRERNRDRKIFNEGVQKGLDEGVEANI